MNMSNPAFGGFINEAARGISGAFLEGMKGVAKEAGPKGMQYLEKLLQPLPRPIFNALRKSPSMGPKAVVGIQARLDEAMAAHCENKLVFYLCGLLTMDSIIDIQAKKEAAKKAGKPEPPIEQLYPNALAELKRMGELTKDEFEKEIETLKNDKFKQWITGFIPMARKLAEKSLDQLKDFAAAREIHDRRFAGALDDAAEELRIKNAELDLEIVFEKIQTDEKTEEFKHFFKNRRK